VPALPSEVINRVWFDEDADFASRLNGEGLLYAFEGHGHFFERADAFDVRFQIFAAGAGAGAGDGICCFSDDRFHSFLIHFMVVGGDGVHNNGIDAVAFAEFRAKGGVCAFLIVIHGFADVVQEAALFGELSTLAPISAARMPASLETSTAWAS
jgi:hypothetical protein